MSVIHMETEDVRGAAHKIDLAAGDLYNKPPKLRSIASSLRSAWQGGDAAEYASELRRLAGILHNEVINLQRLAQRVRTEVNEWETIDGNHTFQNIIIGGTGFSVSTPTTESNFSDVSAIDWSNLRNAGLAFSGGSIIAASSGGTNPFSWFNFGSDQTKNWFKLINEPLKNARIHTEYHDWGVKINEFIGNQHGGYVGRLQNLGRIIKSPAFQWGVPIGLNAISGYASGEDPAKALVSAGISVGIVKTASHFIPGVGAAMLISSGIQIAGNAVAAGLELSGDHYGAALLQNGMEALDLGGYADDVANAVTDLVLPPWNDPPDFSKVGERFSKFADLGKFIFR